MTSLPPVVKTTTDGLEFRYTCRGKIYIALNYHRGKPTKKKSTWLSSFKRHDEFDLFDETDCAGWSIGGGHFGVTQDATRKLGSRDEHTAFFPQPSNSTDPWHGYPLLIRPSRGGVGSPNGWLTPLIPLREPTG